MKPHPTSGIRQSRQFNRNRQSSSKYGGLFLSSNKNGTSNIQQVGANRDKLMYRNFGAGHTTKNANIITSGSFSNKFSPPKYGKKQSYYSNLDSMNGT